MRICLHLLLAISILSGCFTDRDEAVIEVLKQDLMVKERMAYDNSAYLQAYVDEHPTRPLPLRFFLIQKKLFGYYESLGMNISNGSVIDSLEQAFTKSDKYGVEMHQKSMREIPSDSLGLYLLKSRYLSSIIDLQWQLISKMPNEGFKFKKSNLDVSFKLLSKTYKASDTLKAVIRPVYYNFDYVIKRCSLFKNGLLVANPDIVSGELQFAPLEKGVYTIKIVLSRIHETYFNDPPAEERSFDFVVE